MDVLLEHEVGRKDTHDREEFWRTVQHLLNSEKVKVEPWDQKLSQDLHYLKDIKKVLAKLDRRVAKEVARRLKNGTWEPAPTQEDIATLLQEESGLVRRHPSLKEGAILRDLARKFKSCLIRRRKQADFQSPSSYVADHWLSAIEGYMRMAA